jgi:AraC-like DNA-binding protein
MDSILLNQLRKITPEEQELLSNRTEINRSIYMKENSAQIDRSLLLEKEKLITLRPHTRFVHFPKHTHNYVEMVYMCHGRTKHLINGSEVILNKGELLLLSQNATQEIFPAGEDDIAVNFIIWPQFFDTTIQMIGQEENLIRDFLVGCLTEQKNGAGYLHFQVADILPIQNLIENLIWTLVNHQANKRSINQLTMGILFLQLVNHTETLQYDSRYMQQQLMISVLRYVEEHYCNGTLQDISNELHYDVCWLSREIKKQSGKTFTQLMQNKRLSQAAFLLKNTNMKVIEISESVGYENLSYFHRIFEQRFEMSPRKYRVCK